MVEEVATGRVGLTGWLWRYGWVALLTAAAVTAILYLWHPKENSSAADGYSRIGATQVAVLSSLPGSEISPALSPDGTRVAYAWNGISRGNFDIYVKTVGSSASPVRITSDDEDELWPAWSPDGRQLAYVRDGAIYVNSVNGDEERKVTEAAAGSISWTADGKWIAASSGKTGIVLVRVKDGGKRWVLHTGKQNYGDPFFALSQDLKKAIFARYTDEASSDLFFSTDLQDATRPVRRLTSHERGIYGLAWAEQQSSLFFASGRDAFSSRLYRLAFDALGNAKIEELPLAGDHVAEPSVQTNGPATNVAYTRIRVDTNLWYGKAGQEPRRILSWETEETAPQLSPDGGHVAFVSNKSGHEEVWVCRIDGGDIKAVSALDGARITAVRWSPDGKAVAFSAERAGARDIYSATFDGRPLKRLTDDPAEDSQPAWSADGKLLYFSSNRTGRNEIWKMPATGGAAEKVTEDGGYESAESSDGKYLYFTRAGRQGLWRLAAGAKEPQRLLYLVEPGYWGISDKGVSYADLPRLDDLPLRERLLEWAPWGADPSTSVMFYDFATRGVRKQREVGAAMLRSRPGLSVSRDGNALVWAQVDSAESDLMMLELRAP